MFRSPPDRPVLEGHLLRWEFAPCGFDRPEDPIRALFQTQVEDDASRRSAPSSLVATYPSKLRRQAWTLSTVLGSDGPYSILMTLIDSHCTKKRCLLQLQVQEPRFVISLQLPTSGSGDTTPCLQVYGPVAPPYPFPSAQILQCSSTIRRSNAPLGRLPGLLGRTPYSPSHFSSPRVPTPWPFDRLRARPHVLIRMGHTTAPLSPFYVALTISNILGCP